MNDFNEMVKQYTVKHNRKINTITAPIKQLIGDCSFAFSKIEWDGSYFTISDDPYIQEFYYGTNLFMKNPYNSHPDLIRSGMLLIPNFYDLPYKKILHESLKLEYGFIIIQNVGDAIECFYFDCFIKDKINPNKFFTHLDLIKKFIKYFKREAKSMLIEMRKDGFNMKQAKGPAFYKIDPSDPLANKDPNVDRFLKIIAPLSKRERQCLQLFKEGKSAQSTGAILGISQRTVESYFDNIKNKLGCYSKADLLEW